MELVLTGIRKDFGEKKVLRDVSCTFEKGKIYGLLGRNGAGKTTLFNCLAGELDPDGGTARLTEDGLSRPLDVEDVGYVFSTPILPEFLTGYEFVRFLMDIHRQRVLPGKTADDYFELVQMAPEDRHRLIKGYSHGMKNKMQMLSFFITRPPIILLDEPLTSFDVVVALEMKKLLRDMKQDHILIFSTHILQLATDLCDEIAVLHQGALELVDPAAIHSPAFEEKVVEILKDEGDGG